MKLEKLKKQTMVITTPKGFNVEISFNDFVMENYNRQKRSISPHKYLLINKEVLVSTWEHMKKEVENQAKANSRPHRRAWLSVKYWVKGKVLALKSLLKLG